MTDHFELSTMTGTVAMSGSAAIRRRNRVIAATPSSIASSMFTSISWAPLVDLLAGDVDRLVLGAIGDQPGELARAGHVRPLADVDERVARRRDDQRLEPGQAGRRRSAPGSGAVAGPRPRRRWRRRAPASSRSSCRRR